METALKAAVAGLTAVAAVLALKRDNPAGAFVLALAVGTVILSATVGIFSPAAEFLSELAEAAGLSGEILGTLLRVLAVASAAHIASESCRDAGERGVGAAIDLAGGAAALVVSLPLLSAVFSFLRGFAGH